MLSKIPAQRDAAKGGLAAMRFRIGTAFKIESSYFGEN